MGEIMLKAEEIKLMVERRTGIDPGELSPEEMKKAECWDKVFLVPGDFNTRASYIADVLVQMLGGNKIKDVRLRMAVGTLCQALSYLMNSRSWWEGQLFDFDEDELRRKLTRISRDAADGWLEGL